MAGGGCIWCGKTPVTDEHLIPIWASAVLDGDLRTISEPGLHIRYNKHLETETQTQWKNESQVQFVAKCVCESCNGGWMSEIENQAKTFMTPMIRGEGIALDGEARHAVAAWLGLKTIIERYTQSPVVPVAPDLLQYFRKHRSPPPYWYIWVTRYVGSYPAHVTGDLTLMTRSLGSRMPFSVKRYRMLMTAVIGYFGAQVFAPEKPVDLKARRQNSAIFIWPPQPVGAVDRPDNWPPAGTLTDASLELISQLVNGMPRYLPSSSS